MDGIHSFKVANVYDCYTRTTNIPGHREEQKTSHLSTIAIGWMQVCKKPTKAKHLQKMNILFDSGCGATLVKSSFGVGVFTEKMSSAEYHGMSIPTELPVHCDNVFESLSDVHMNASAGEIWYDAHFCSRLHVVTLCLDLTKADGSKLIDIEVDPWKSKTKASIQSSCKRVKVEDKADLVASIREAVVCFKERDGDCKGASWGEPIRKTLQGQA